MYSGSTLTNFSGNVVGAHQKIDRIARKHLALLGVQPQLFPSVRQILRFEGKNGPDAAKSKLDSEHAPWHFYDPFDPDDGMLLEQIMEHYKLLVTSLRKVNRERSAFESSWLAHAIVDGLTPAHHFPFEAELENLRGEGKETRDTVLKKVLIPASTTKELISKNWAFWGAKGLFTNHFLFEWGAAAVFAPLNASIGYPSRYDIKKAQEIGLAEAFKRTAREIALLDMYDRFCTHGWSPKLANDVRKELAPRMIRMVAIAWYMAYDEAYL